jgi:hypothetical protein
MRHCCPRYLRRPTAAASCRGPGMPVPRARHGHAAALGSQAPRACVRTHTARPSHVQPSHAHATATPCAITPAMRPRRRVRVAAKPLRHIPEHLSGALSHAHTHTRTRVCHTGPEPRHTGSRGGRQVGPPCQRRRRQKPPGREVEKAKRSPARGEEGEREGPAQEGEGAGPREDPAEPLFHA